MGFMDKAKEAAMQAKTSAQQMAQQGQAKVQAAQHGRSENDLLRQLGEAVYNEQRRGGDPTTVQAALAALDAHYASSPPPGPGAGPAPMAPGDTSYGAPQGYPPPTAAPGAAPAAPAPAAPPPAGDFTLDDL